MQHRHVFAVVTALLLASTCIYAATISPTQTPPIKSQQHMALVMSKAKYYLSFRLNENQRLAHPQKMAIVFDTNDVAKKFAMPYINTLSDFATAHHIAVFFVDSHNLNQHQIITNAGYDIALDLGSHTFETPENMFDMNLKLDSEVA